MLLDCQDLSPAQNLDKRIDGAGRAARVVTERTTYGIREQALAEGTRIERVIRAAMGRTVDARTLSALARKARMQRATLYAWFDGQRPEPETQQRVAEALGVRREELWPSGEESTGTETERLIGALLRQAAAITMLAERLDRMTSPEWLAECVVASMQAVALSRATEQSESGPTSALVPSSHQGRA